MLQLKSYKYGTVVTNTLSHFNMNLFSGLGTRPFGYFNATYIADAMLPLAMNEINLYQATAVWNSETCEENTLHLIFDYFKEHNSGTVDNKLNLHRIYTNDIDKVLELMDSDLYINPKEGIQELYNKAMQQARDREGLTRDVKTVVKVSKIGREILLISDWVDHAQMSDGFLTLGLIPVLFQDLKELFDELEIDYFKSLVARSQVKRISNVKVGEAFDKLQLLEKYKERLLKVKLSSSISSILKRRISSARNQITRAQDEAENYLQNYARALNRYNEAQKLIKQLEADEDSLFEEYKQALSYDNILDVQVEGDTLRIIASAPVEYYNTDEVECMLSGIPQGNFRQFINDVFLEQKYKLHVIASFTFNVGDPGAFLAPRAISGSQCKYYDSLYNPHFQYYGCLGDYRAELAKAHADQDLLIYNNLAIAALKSFNFADGTVMNNFRSTLNSYFANYNDYDRVDYMTAKCLEDEDGNRFSLKDIYIDKVNEPVEPEAVESIEVREV